MIPVEMGNVYCIRLNVFVDFFFDGGIIPPRSPIAGSDKPWVDK
jgi:hypothetical protein